MSEISLSLDNINTYMALFGLNDKNSAVLEQECNVNLFLKNNTLEIRGDENACLIAESAIRSLLRCSDAGESTDLSRIRYCIMMAKEGRADDIADAVHEIVAVTHRGRPIKCKTIGQCEYINAIRNHDLTFAIGPAGTGKTYLAMALAVSAFKAHEVEKIILTRPAVETGEKLGFLPGDLNQKVEPYLRPLYDALYEFLGVDSYQKLVERGVIEVAPLAYMRGRTLSDAFVILDEAQNTTPEQMKMFLTRIGFGSRVVITGDITQTDLPYGRSSGLREALNILHDIEEIGFVYLTDQDVVRHDLVRRIIRAYSDYESNKASTDKSPEVRSHEK